MEVADPLILIEGEEGPQEGPPRPGTPRVFDTVAELIAAVEAPDVRYGLYQAFDTTGRRLRLEAAGDTGPITATFEPGAYAEDLRVLIAAYLRRSPPPGPAIDPDLPLGGLIASLRRANVDRRVEQRARRRALLERVGLWLVLVAAIVLAQPPVLQPREEISGPIFVVLWVAVAGAAYWLAGRLLVLFRDSSTRS